MRCVPSTGLAPGVPDGPVVEVQVAIVTKTRHPWFMINLTLGAGSLRRAGEYSGPSLIRIAWD